MFKDCVPDSLGIFSECSRYAYLFIKTRKLTLEEIRQKTARGREGNKEGKGGGRGIRRGRGEGGEGRGIKKEGNKEGEGGIRRERGE